jgi:hypothetical protein
VLNVVVWLVGADVGAIGVTVNLWWPLLTGRRTIRTQARRAWEARQLAQAQDREAGDDACRFRW